MQKESEESLESREVSTCVIQASLYTYLQAALTSNHQLILPHQLELHERYEQELEQLRVDLKENAKQQLAEQRDTLDEKHREEMEELKKEHEGEIKVCS